MFFFFFLWDFHKSGVGHKGNEVILKEKTKFSVVKYITLTRHGPFTAIPGSAYSGGSWGVVRTISSRRIFISVGAQ